ncbi:MAG: excinuclease ABC subunit UvrC [Geminicoccaceae bacterium]
MTDDPVGSAPDTVPPQAPLKGAALIRALLATLPDAPGVYRMQDDKGEVLYVGKAKSLRKRVVAYSKPQAQPARIQRMVALTRAMEFVQTATEVEALLLEANLIKRMRPVFNIVLRDDKSFPYIALRTGHAFPLIGKHRGAKRAGTEYFGPFASAGAVNDTLNALLKAFPLRSCRDSIFESRSRPCLQFQIKRCSAPCVGRIAPDAYARIVAEVREFLTGRSREVQARLQAEMAAAAEALDFEKAAVLRDRLKAMAHIQSRQGINTDAVDDADVIAAHAEGGQVCVQVFFYRDGRNYGNRAYYPAHAADAALPEIVEAFAAQFYTERPPARLVLLAEPLPQQDLLADALSVRAGRKVELAVPKRGDKRQLVEIAQANARAALARRLSETSSQAALLEKLADSLDLPDVPRRIEVYDNSHIQGTNAIGAFVVAGPEGFDKRQYRTFNIRQGELTPGDDYAMMRQVLTRRFARLVKEDPERQGGSWPDLVIIDGGPGQLAAATAILGDLDLTDIAVMAVAKGPDRNAGRERLHLPGREPIALDPKDPVLYLLQRLRDEAHRFAIATHRGRRAAGLSRSALDRVPGIGARRKKALLAHFGSAEGVRQAGLLDLEQVPGISTTVARTIYDHFHESG